MIPVPAGSYSLAARAHVQGCFATAIVVISTWMKFFAVVRNDSELLEMETSPFAYSPGFHYYYYSPG